EAAVFGNGKGGKLYAAYQERLKILNAADFGDLLLENIRLFREQPDVLKQYQQRFKFILVDEYQDTNVAQYLWLRLLSQAPAARAGAPLSAVIPGDFGTASPGGVQGRAGGANHHGQSQIGQPGHYESSRDSGFAPDSAPRNDVRSAAPSPSSTLPPKNICCV